MRKRHVYVAAVLCTIALLLIPGFYFVSTSRLNELMFCFGAAVWNLVMILLLVCVLGLFFQRPEKNCSGPDRYLKLTFLMMAKVIWAISGLVSLLFIGNLTVSVIMSICVGIGIPLISLILIGIFYTITHRQKVN